MSVKTIPEQTIVTCDFCGRNKGDVQFKKGARLNMRRDALDYLGDPCANASYSFDACDGCESKITEALNLLVTKEPEAA